MCDPTLMICGCAEDSQCPSGDYCDSGTCAPKEPDGDPCTTANQCQSGLCADGACNGIVATGNGFCALREGGGEGGGAAGFAGLVLVAAGLGRRRSRRRP
jgi:Cys-rich repeat protein